MPSTWKMGCANRSHFPFGQEAHGRDHLYGWSCCGYDNRDLRSHWSNEDQRRGRRHLSGRLLRSSCGSCQASQNTFLLTGEENGARVQPPGRRLSSSRTRGTKPEEELCDLDQTEGVRLVVQSSLARSLRMTTRSSSIGRRDWPSSKCQKVHPLQASKPCTFAPSRWIEPASPPDASVPSARMIAL